MGTDPRYAPVGALAGEGGTRFTVWAPSSRRVDVHIVEPFDRSVEAVPEADGYHSVAVPDAGPGARYRLRLDDGRELPDPASRHQPDGVHGPSEVAERGYDWTDAGWRGHDLRDYVIYEAHVGTLTAAGTFEGAVAVLDELAAIGVTALELMPVAAFPGSRNWGYDGVYPFAAQATYGGPAGLKRLVDACHARGLAVVLDVVYNHLGPEGCYLDAFGPYFTDRYRTPWGRAINFDGEGSDEVRRFFIGNALYWLDEFHIDALRLDAVHAIADPSAFPFIEELANAVAERGFDPVRYLIAESASNDSRLIRPREAGGVGLDAQWNDDFHHALISAVTGESQGYFADYGSCAQLARAYAEGFVYQGERSSFRGRRYGRPSSDLAPCRFVVFSHNHDQVGNRPAGDRPSVRLPTSDLELLAAAVLLGPGIPLLFMGEEYGELAAFPYFVSHSDPELVEAVRRGRREEFASFDWNVEPPDPQSEETFAMAKLDRMLAGTEPHRSMQRHYTDLIALRRKIPAISRAEHVAAEVTGGHVVIVRMSSGSDEATLVLNLGEEPAALDPGSAERLYPAADGDESAVPGRSAVLFRKGPG